MRKANGAGRTGPLPTLVVYHGTRRGSRTILHFFISRNPLTFLIEALYNSIHNQEEIEMEKATKKAKISKKVLIAEIEKMGVDTKITQSLGRANIETIVWVKSLIKS